ncbi:TetR/AcrR family transcriptional regulator [Gordonia terrae]|uniref:TetR/AcrR family transcriptional regulator n=2 Tax=Gordonia terrae TaxID=2055 RepID=A0AAD0K4G4_9ACTN|nr:TetR/AcrR family transcriptional regulator [Gordonia terrae]AWO82908.1 TetR/AcrR family transcriptional regulator [Gordonia terrae]VTR09548.1 TetR family transcriptional regulator [Clostridioides difficile]VTS28893.1 HTH-type transcriptional regulator EthR [Gordonia terrae]
MSNPTTDRAREPLIGDRRVSAPAKGERQRRSLLDGIARLLTSRSIDELGIAEIANEAGVSRSAFYAYFDSKYAALAVLTSEAWATYADQTDVFTRQPDEDPAAFLDRTGRAALGIWKKHAAVLVASIQAIPVDPRIAALWNTWNRRLTDALTEQLRDDIRAGLAHPATDDVARLITDLNYMMQHAFYLNCVSGADHAETLRMFNSVTAIWLAAAWGRGTS